MATNKCEGAGCRPKVQTAAVERRSHAENARFNYVLRLVPPAPLPVRRETIEDLEILLAGARKGQLVGFAFAAISNKCEHFVGVTGNFRTDQTLARGAIAALDDELRELVQAAAC